VTAAWTVPSRLPSRAALDPTRLGRRPTPRELHDHCIDAIAAAVHAGDAHAARAFHAAAQALPALVEVWYEAHLWAAQEATDWARITDDQLDSAQSRITAALPRARNRAAQ